MGLEYIRLGMEPRDNITGGWVQYCLDPDTGIITLTGEADVHVWLLGTRKYPISGEAKVDPLLVKSENIKVGQTFDFGSVLVSVQSVDAVKKIATCAVTVRGSVAGSGTATFDLSGPTIVLTDILLVAHVPIIGNETLHAFKL